MPPRPKPFAGVRRRVRRALGRLLPAPVVEAAQAAYFGRWWLPRAGDADEPDLVVARALLAAGATAIDGGANFGRYADAFAAAVGPAGRVLAVEPVPRTARLLRRVLRHRGRPQVEVVEAALADAPGTGRMVVPSDASGEANYFRAHLSADGPAAVGVALETLDRLAARLPRPPALVKLDLEGHERVALGGAAALLAAGPAWLLEMNDDPDTPGSDAHAVEAILASHGYAAWTFDAPAATLRPRRPGPRGPNVFFLLPAHVERLRAAGAIRIAD